MAVGLHGVMEGQQLKITRLWSATGVAALTGALLLTSAPSASADYIRDKQWTLDAFDIEAIWEQSRGRGVTVAVVDTGVQVDHPDLKGQVVKGLDAREGGSNPEIDSNGHGTRMASLIAGHGHGPANSDGVVGLAPESKIMPIRASDGGEGGFEEGVWAKGVRYAVDNGAKVINLSIGDSHGTEGTAGAEAIAYAQSKDVVVVASAGNDGIGMLEFPAKTPGVVSVGAVDESRNLWENSNYGKGMTLLAPGENIVAADPTIPSGYSEGDGTSDSTAFVSATAALIRAKYPDLTAGQVINRMIKSTTFLDHNVEKVPDEHFGYGILRPNKALRMDIPAGPKAGPLPQAPSDEPSEPSTNDTSPPKADDGDMLSPSTILLIAGIVFLLGAVGVIFLIARVRNTRSRGPGAGSPMPGGGFQQYPGPMPNQPGPYSQHPPQNR
ncbi:type VII secretion-associated serine protease mycosin [Streptomyces sp. LHD-70]|uniref:type VII secretion-associated serine protease mycosin n=1 Tax=Streptomyces sp. LHD-70 TaxID=3072140 RepID=UPI00280FDBEF|nr:type VII secretion-associated serine protease mycosin [Streptomyces sp. LHD-70]MDQ8708321.1 type VII secretion-associated serine protease mycosin [Streptomyces sp. LHD-70]